MSTSNWPNESPFALCLTHDVDRIKKYAYHYLYYGLTKDSEGLNTQIKTLTSKIKGQEPYWNFEELMKLEDHLGIRSTFFFLNEHARGFGPKYWGRYDIRDLKVKNIIRELNDGGWEIGLHGSYCSYKDKRLLAEEKHILEDLLGKRVRSVRQHFLNLLPGYTWRIQAEIGLEFDSSVGSSTQVREENINNPFPYYPDTSGMLELPITVMDTIGLEKTSVRSEVEGCIEKVIKAGGLIVLDWHQCAFNKIENSSRTGIYTDILDTAINSGAWIATMAEIGDYWKNNNYKKGA